MDNTLSEIYRICLKNGLDNLLATLDEFVNDRERTGIIDLEARYAGMSSDLDNKKITMEMAAIERASITRVLRSLLEKIPGERRVEILRHLAGTSADSKKLTILFTSASPTDQFFLQTDLEYKRIRAMIKDGSNHVGMELMDPILAASVRDLVNGLQDTDPWMVHISSHGSEDGIVLADEKNIGVLVSNKTLLKLFTLNKGRIACIFLNGCLTKFPARLVSSKGIAVIGMNDFVEDDMAIQFAEAFYNYLGKKGDFKDAFCFACLELEVDSWEKASVPEFWNEGKKIKCTPYGKTGRV